MMSRIVLVAVALRLAIAASSVAAQGGVGNIITESIFNNMLPNRDNSSCPAKGFYTYDAFIAAANAFPAFGTSGSAELMKRELAAFFGQTSQETTGRTIAADGQYQWGYCYKEANETFKHSGSRPYYGRGPIQLEWEWNYKAAGSALGVDLVSNPDLVSTDPVISFKTAIWFWMTAQSPRPSCHDVIIGNWKPTAGDGGAAPQVPGYGVISQLMNGGIECGRVPSNVDNINRIGYYKRYCDMLGTGTGDNVDCYTLQRFPNRPNVEAPPAPVSRSQLKTIILSSVLGSAAAIAITAAAVYFYFTSKYRRWKKEQDKLAKAMQNLPGMPTQIDYAEIRKATKGFHATTKLGKGGFGAVYRCTLPAAASRTGQAMEVAVKKFMRELEDRRYNDFLAEVSIINRLRHKNIVPLVGWSYNKGEPLLVYEYMTNGSLDQHLFRNASKGNNTQEEAATGHWDTRYGIVRDVATGLHYVHHEHEPMVLHRDIKASNIMLDSTFSARLGDFGIACTVAVDRSSVTGVAGTIGYIAPDYAISHKATRHSDIYAFGVLVLEIVTGKKSSDVPPDDGHITDWVWRLHQEGKLLEAVDSSMVATCDSQQEVADEANRLLLLGLACTNPNPFSRPSMVEVVQMINKLAPAPEVPLERPAFVWPPEDWRTRNSVYSTAMSNWERSSESTTEVDNFSPEQPLSVTSGGRSSFHRGAPSMELYPLSVGTAQH